MNTAAGTTSDWRVNSSMSDDPNTSAGGLHGAAAPGPATSASRESAPGALRTLGRAAARRCPNCGSGAIFRSYLAQHPSCPDCGLRLDRGESDFFIGAYTINLIVAELLVVFGGLAVLLWTWPAVPWSALMWGLAALMIAAPIALYPVSRQLWLACDLIFRPAETADFATLETP
jgi:uncharacterized protein (DUF983 family)